MTKFDSSGSFWRNGIQNRDIFYWSSVSKRYTLAWFTGLYRRLKENFCAQLLLILTQKPKLGPKI